MRNQRPLQITEHMLEGIMEEFPELSHDEMMDYANAIVAEFNDGLAGLKQTRMEHNSPHWAYNHA